MIKNECWNRKNLRNHFEWQNAFYFFVNVDRCVGNSGKNRMYLCFFFLNISFIFTEIWENGIVSVDGEQTETRFHSQFRWCVVFLLFHWNRNLKYTLKVFNMTTKFIGFSLLSGICYCTPHISNAFYVKCFHITIFTILFFLPLLFSQLTQFPPQSISEFSVFILWIHVFSSISTFGYLLGCKNSV